MMQLTMVLLPMACTAQSPEAPSAETDIRCGAYTLYVGLKALDARVPDYASFEQRLGEPPPAGYSLGQVAEVAESYGMHTLGVHTTLENLGRRRGRFVCIAHVNGRHFVNVGDVHGGIVSIVDPPREYALPADTFNTQWDGTALLVSAQPLVPERDLPHPFQWRRWLLTGLLCTLILYTACALLRRRRGAPAGD